MPETNKLRIRAEGFIMEIGKEKIAINAKYPEAPPCPTLEYKKATNANNAPNTIQNSLLVIAI